MSFNWFQLIPEVGHEYAHVATAGAVAGGLLLTGAIARKSLGTGESAVTPIGKVSVRGALEMITEFIAGLCDSIIGEHGRKYGPMFATIFTFVIINNLVGLIPGMTPATENINMSFAMGVFVFLVYNFMGFKENGLGYLKHFAGPIWWLAPFLFVLELISHIVRPFSLGLRLANVMMGDHTVVSVFLDMAPIGAPLPFYLMGMLVSFIQAFVFTLLSMVYIAIATAHDH